MSKVAPEDVHAKPRESNGTKLQVVPGNGDSEHPRLVRWQWMHAKGWRDYDVVASEKIERAYQKGEPKVRIKTGKSKKVPMVIFFLDKPMKQFDPTTQNVREVQRVGPSNKLAIMKLGFSRMRTRLASGRIGRAKPELAENFQQRKSDLYKNVKFEYNVFDYYHERGWCAFVAKSELFFVISMLAVVFNGVWIAIDVDLNTASSLSDVEPEFVIVENALCAIFTVELSIRFGAFQSKWNAFMDAWFRLDFFLVALMVVETWAIPATMSIIGGKSGSTALGDLSILRIARIMRLARMTRLLRVCPEVVTLLKGIAKAVRSVFLAMALLCIVLYVSAIVCRTLVRDVITLEEVYFSSMSHALGTLLLYCTFLDNVSFLLQDTWAESGFVLTSFLLLVIFLSSFTILNMLIGILCEVVSSVSNTEKEEADVSYLKSNLMQLMEAYDAEDNQHLGKEEFSLLMENPDVVNVLNKFGTAPEGLLDIIDLLFENGATKKHDTNTDSQTFGPENTDEEQQERAISFEEFIQLVSRMRGSNQARVKDIVELREYTRQCVKRLEGKIGRQDRLEKRVSRFFLNAEINASGDLSALNDDYEEHAGNTTQRRHSASEETSQVGIDTHGIVVVEASFAGKTSFHRHSSRLKVGEFLEQLAPEYGQLKAMDFDGYGLGLELCLGDIVGSGGSDMQGQLAVRLRLVPLPRVQEFKQSCGRQSQLEEKLQRVPASYPNPDCSNGQVEEQPPSPPSWPCSASSTSGVLITEHENKSSSPPPPTTPPPELPKTEESAAHMVTSDLSQVIVEAEPI